MKKQSLNLSSFVIIILFTFSLAYSSEKSIAKGKASIIDGDTIKINAEKIRFAGIDTPESRTRNLEEKALGLKAKKRLTELCVGSFKIKSLGKGKYGRILGIPYTELDEDVCEILVVEGHAVEYFGGKKT